MYRYDSGCSVYAVQYQNAQVLVLENASVRLALLPEYGATVIEYLYKPMNLNLVWRTPMWKENLRHKQYMLYSSQAVSDTYLGGWFDIFPSIGLSGEHQVPQYLQHGELLYLPWEYRIDVQTKEQVQVTLWACLSKQAVRVQKTITLRCDSTEIACALSMENFGPVDVPYHWGFHPTVGKPFLSEACEIQVGTENLGFFPREGSGIRHLLTRENLGVGTCEIRNRDLGLSFHMRWKLEDFPDALIWICGDYGCGHHSFGGGHALCVLPRDSLLDGADPETARLLHPEETIQTSYCLSAEEENN